MPSAADHFRFASALLAGRENAASASGAPPFGLSTPGSIERDLILIGTQGPDPFFFYGLVPWRHRENAEATRSFGSYLHSVDPADYFNAVATTGAESRRYGSAFIYGLILHYALDRALHPYVFFESGFDDSGELSSAHAINHAYFETMMAEAGKSGEKPGHTRPRRMFSVSAEALTVADSAFAAAFPNNCPFGRFAAGWQDMTTVLETLWDPFRWKRPGLRALLGADSHGYAMIRPRMRRHGDTTDYLNASGQVWRHPVSGETSSASVAELTVTAAVEADRALALLTITSGAGPNAAQSDLGFKTAPEWQALFGGVNHDGLRQGERFRFKRSGTDISD